MDICGKLRKLPEESQALVVCNKYEDPIYVITQDFPLIMDDFKDVSSISYFEPIHKGNFNS